MKLINRSLSHQDEIRSYREILIQEYSLRKIKNAKFSIRSFAARLKISKTSLADVMTGKRKISLANAKKINNALALPPLVSQALLSQVQNKQSPNEAIDYTHHQLRDDEFQLIAQWYYFAILNLAKLPEHSADLHWIAQRLCIDRYQVETALLCLQRLGYIKVENGKLVRLVCNLHTKEEVSSSAIRNHHKEHLSLAAESLERDSIHSREFCSLTLPIDPNDIQKAKNIIRNFKLRFDHLLKTETPKEVYQLSIQFFPLTQKSKKENHEEGS